MGDIRRKILAIMITIVVLVNGKIQIAFAEEIVENGIQNLEVEVQTSNTENLYEGDEIKFSLISSGGDGEYEYCYILNQGEEKRILQDYSTVNEYILTTREAGTYVMIFLVRDSSGKSVEKEYEFTVKEKEEALEEKREEETENKFSKEEEQEQPAQSELDNVMSESVLNAEVKQTKKVDMTCSVSSSMGTNVSLGTEVTLQANQRGAKGQVEYRFTEEYKGEVKTVRGFEENNSYTFKAKGIGVHTYHLAIRDEEGQSVSTKYTINVQIPTNKKLTGGISSNKGNVVNIGEEVILSAKSTGGYGKVEYRFTEEYKGEVKTVRGFEENNSYTFKAKGIGIHTYHLAVRDEEGQAVSTKYTINVQIPSSKKLTGSISSNKGNAVNIGEEVILSAKSTGGYGKVEYRFTEEYKGEVKTVRGFEENNSYTFKAKGIGVHTYHLAIRDEEGQSVSTKYSACVVVAPDKKLNIQIEGTSGGVVNIRDDVVLQAKHTGGYGKIKYRFTEVYKGNTVTVRPYEENDSYKFKATGPGLHVYHLAAQDEEGQVVSITYSVTVSVSPEYKLSGSLKSNKTAREYVDRQVTLKGKHTGGYGKVEYRFTEVYNGRATTVQPYGEKSEYTFRTTKPGIHTYHLAIRDEEGQTISMQYSMEVVVHPDYKLTGTLKRNITGEIKENQKIVLTAKAQKGYGEPYLYRFTEVYNGKATTVQSYSEKNTYEFVIKGQGTHKYTVAIMDCEGQTISLSQTINIGKNGWFYELGYKFYYKNGVKQLDLDGILPRQSSYYIEVNRTTCSVTVYAKDGNNGYIIPVKRFACSVGLPSTPTPTGTYYTPAKYRWHTLMGPSYGQYCTRIVGGVLFHSVAGYNMTSYNIRARDFNKLGQPASHGCVRLCVRDAKWIYDNCPLGTKVRIYDSSNPGPLGKPATIKIPDWQNWDPTDPNI